MRARDLIVEVRDVNLQRLGRIDPDLLDLRATLRYLGVGDWELRLPAEDPAAIMLRQPGAGLIVTHVDLGVVFSGPRKTPTLDATSVDPFGLLTVKGVTDSAILWHYNTRPLPGAAIGAQGLAYDVRSGTAEAVMRGYVNANLGPGAAADRRISALTLDPDLGRGGTTKRSTRFDVLGDLLAEIASAAGLGFDVIQNGLGLRYRTLVPVDRRAMVRLDLRSGTLTSTKSEDSGYEATHVVVAGQGKGEARTLIERSTVASRAWAAQWGPWGRIETFKDQRQTDDLLELQQAGDEVIAEGAAALAVKAVAADDSGMEFMRDWGLGDYLTAVIEGAEGSVQATSAELRISSDGFRMGLGLGDVVGYDPVKQTAKRLDAADARLANLERNAEAAVAWDASAVVSGVLNADRVPTALRGVSLPDGQYVELQSTTSSGGIRRYEDGVLTGTVAFFGASVRLQQSGYGGSPQGGTLRVNASGVIDHNTDGGGYKPIPHAEAAGFTDLTATTGSTGVSTMVTMPAGRFDVGPLIQVSRANATAATAKYAPYATSITPGTFTIGAVAADGVAANGLVRISWYARQMTPTNATG